MSGTENSAHGDAHGDARGATWGIARRIALGAAVPLGWAAHDALVFTSHGWPFDAWRLVPSTLLTVGVVAIASALLGQRTLLAAGALVGGLGLTALGVRDGVADTAVLRALPGVLGGLFVAWSLARLVAGSLRASGACLGFALGAAASVGWAAASLGIGALDASSGWAVGVAGGVGIAAFLGGWLRPVVALVALVAPLPWLLDRQAWFLTPGRAPLAAPSATAPEDAPDVLLVIVDTLRAESLAPYGYARVTTPELDAFVDASMTRYSRARSTSSWTLPSHASLLTGLLPAEHGVTHSRTAKDEVTLRRMGLEAYPLRAEVPTLAERLRERGYETGAIISNSSTLRVEYGLERGFRTYDALPGSYVGRYLAMAQVFGGPLWVGHRPYRDAETITDLAIDWLRERGEAPTFLALNYMDAHWPYMPRAPFDTLDFGDGPLAGATPRDPLAPDKELLSTLYDRELRFLDRELMRLVRWLEAEGRLDGTLLVITSDHGEAFGDHGLWKHDWMLYDELVHVPLYVKPAGGRSAALDDTPLHSADVSALIARAAGLGPLPETGEAPDADAPFAEWYYNSRIPAPEAFVVDPEAGKRHLVGWTDGRTKYIVSSLGVVEIYDLESDPDELSPRKPTREEQRAWRQRARAWWDANPIPDATRQPAHRKSADADEIEARLRELGYVGDE